MLSRPLGLEESNDRGRGFVTSPHALLPLAEEEDDDDDDGTHKGTFSSAPPWSSSSSSASSSPSPPRYTSSSSFVPSPASRSLFSPPSLPPQADTPPYTIASSPLNPPSLLLLSSAPPPAPHVCLPSFFCPPSSITVPPAPLTVFCPVSSPPTSLSSPPYTAAPAIRSSLHPPPPPPSHLLTPVFSVPSPYSSSPLISLPLSTTPPSLSLPSAPPPPIFSTPLIPPCTSVDFSPPSTAPSPSVVPPLSSPTSSAAPRPPFAPAPSCACASLLPRLLASHRAEVRRLLRGALTSLGRRLDSLERRSRGKRRSKKKRRRGEEGGAVPSPRSAANSSSGSFSSSSSSNHAPLTLATSSTTSSSSSSSSSDGEDSLGPTLSSEFSHSEQRRRRRQRRRGAGGEDDGRSIKRRRKEEEGVGGEEEEEDYERFVGRMMVSYKGGGAEEEAPLTLHNFHHARQRGGTGQSEKPVSIVMAGRNGFPEGRAEIHRSSSSPSSHHALDLLHSSQRGWTSSQSDPLNLSTGRWSFSSSSPFLSLLSNHSAFRLCLHASSSSSLFSPAPMLRLSAVAVETLTLAKDGDCGRPFRPLKDWTTPPSLGIDHCYVKKQSSSFSARRQKKQRANHSAQSLRCRPLPLPACSTNGTPPPLLDAGQSVAASEYVGRNKERGKRVSQIRIRRASPRETPLTPMGLPKVKRLKKKEFSLEEIYTNKNYKSPTANRSLETIYEEPREKDGALLVIGHQRRRRLLLFPDFTQPRKRRKPQAMGLPVVMAPRKRSAARRHCHGNGGIDDEADLDVMLVERLSALEDFLLRQGLDV